MIDMMNAMFRSGVPYDAEKNTFEVRTEHFPLIEQQRKQIAEEKARTSLFRPLPSWDSWDD